jgi:hypothetical protein
LAGNTVTSITTQARAGFNSVAISASLGGDDDTSAVCKIFYGADTTVTDTGMTMYRRVGTKKYEGRILWLLDNNTYWYKVVVKDGASTFITPFASVSTIKKPSTSVLRPSMANYYVNQTTGKDSNTGLCSENCLIGAGPKKTIQSAIDALTASGSPGNVFVQGGHYHEQVTLGGSGTVYRALVGVNGDDGNKPIICGSYESWEYAPVSFNLYSLQPDANGGDVWYTTAATMADSISLVVLAQDANGYANLTYASRRTSKRAMLADSVYVASIGSTPAKVARESWFVNGDTLFVRVFSQDGPTGDGNLPIYLGYRGDLIKITASKWTVSNMKLQYAGGPLTTVSNFDPAPLTHGHSIEVGAYATSVSSTNIVDNDFYGMSNAAIYAPIWAGNGVPDSLTVVGNNIDGIGIGKLYYSETKGRLEEGINGVVVVSARPLVFGNVIAQVCNGIQTGTGASTETDSSSGSWAELSKNTITDINDDAIELDLGHNINTLVSENTIKKTGHVISVSPTLTGPTFIIRNLAWGFDGGIKHGYKTPKADGIVVAIHNTLVAQREPTAAGNHAYPFDNASSDSLVRNFKSYNNIYAAAYTAINGNLESDTTSNYFNYDALAGATNTIVKWNNRNYSRTLLSSNIGWEVNGRDVSALSVFADTVNTKTFSLDVAVENGPVDAGLIIKGVNRGIGQARYSGAGPDMGYLESVGTPTQPTNRRKSWLRRLLEGIL